MTANAAKPTVADMGRGGGFSHTLDDEVRNSAASGVFYAVAAGNDGVDTCTNPRPGWRRLAYLGSCRSSRTPTASLGMGLEK